MKSDLAATLNISDLLTTFLRWLVVHQANEKSWQKAPLPQSARSWSAHVLALPHTDRNAENVIGFPLCNKWDGSLWGEEKGSSHFEVRKGKQKQRFIWRHLPSTLPATGEERSQRRCCGIASLGPALQMNSIPEGSTRWSHLLSRWEVAVTQRTVVGASARCGGCKRKGTPLRLFINK